MKSLLIVIAIVGLLYVSFFESKKDANSEKPEVIYQQQMDKAREVETLMQETVEKNLQRLDEMK